MQLCKAFEAHALSEPEQPWSAVVHCIVHCMVYYMVHYSVLYGVLHGELHGALHSRRCIASGPSRRCRDLLLQPLSHMAAASCDIRAVSITHICSLDHMWLPARFAPPLPAAFGSSEELYGTMKLLVLDEAFAMVREGLGARQGGRVVTLRMRVDSTLRASDRGARLAATSMECTMYCTMACRM